MNSGQAAPLYIDALTHSVPANALPAEGNVTLKGKPATRLVKRIVLARLSQAGHTPHRYTGDTYNFQFGGEASRFSFRVAADAGREHWWSNTSLAELASLAADDAVMLLTWHPPGQQRWMHELVVFAVAPQELDAGIRAHEQAIVRSCLESALHRFARYDDRTPGLSERLRAALRMDDIQNVALPPGGELGLRDQMAEAIDEYREQRPAAIGDAVWAEARKQAQRTREALFTVLIQIVPHPDDPTAFRVIHRNSDSVLAELPANARRCASLQLGETESQQLLAAYGEEGAGVPPRPVPVPAPNPDVQEPPTPPIEQDPVELTVERLGRDLVGLPLDEIASQVWGAIATGKHVVLTGAPGTAKTTIALAIASVAAETDRCSTFLFTTATTDWTALDTVGGYVPASDGRGLVFRPGKFLECFRDPGSEEQDFRWLVIDELNRAEVDKAFGQFFTVLSGHPCELPFKRGDSRVVIVPDGCDGEAEGLYDPAVSYVYRVPRNWRMLATLNTDDKASLFEMSFAFLRRFAFVHVPLPTPEGLEEIRRAVLQERIGLTDQRSNQLKSLWSAITAVRPLGPALLIDMAQYLRSRGPAIEQRWPKSVAEAIAMFVVPQLEGLDPEKLRQVRRAVLAEDPAYWTAGLQEAALAFLPAMEDAVRPVGEEADQAPADEPEEQE